MSDGEDPVLQVVAPNPFLEIRVKQLDLDPGLVALCAGYEGGEWRCEQLAAHMCEWLPEFALSNTERESFGAHNAVSLVAKAA